jgi:D-alanine-D-alanine ligase
VVRSAGITTPDWVALPHSTFRELGAGTVLDLMVARLGLPLMVKPASGGSALGVQKIDRVEDLPAAMVSCFAYGDTVMVERFVEGVEVALAVIDLGDGPQALPAVEIEPESGVFDYTARYTPGSPSTTRRPASRTTSPPAPPTSRCGCTRCSAWPISPVPTRSSPRMARCTSSR